MEAVAVLKGCALFKGFTDTGIQILAGIAKERVFPQGATLFTEGSAADSLFIVGEGKVKVSSKNKSGAQVPLFELQPHDHLGELSLIQPGQRMVTAIAHTNVLALELKHAEFQKLLAAKPQA